MANIKTHDSHERTVNVREMDKHRPLFHWISVKINSDENNYLTLKTRRRKYKMFIIDSNAAANYTETTSLIHIQTTTLRRTENWEIFWIYLKIQNCAPILCVVCFFIGSECRCLLYISFRCDWVRKRQSTSARQRYLSAAWNMTHWAFDLALVA